MMPTTTTPNTTPTAVGLAGGGQQGEVADSKLSSSPSSSRSLQRDVEHSHESEATAKNPPSSAAQKEVADDQSTDQEDDGKFLRTPSELSTDETPPPSSAISAVGSNSSEETQNADASIERRSSLNENSAVPKESVEDYGKTDAMKVLFSRVSSVQAMESTRPRPTGDESDEDSTRQERADAKRNLLARLSSPKRRREYSDEDGNKEESAEEGTEDSATGGKEHDLSLKPLASAVGSTNAAAVAATIECDEGNQDAQSDGDNSTGLDVTKQKDHDAEDDDLKMPGSPSNRTDDEGDEELQNEAECDDDHSYEYEETDSAEGRPMEADLLSERCVIGADESYIARLPPIGQEFDMSPSLAMERELGWAQGDYYTVSSSDIGMRHGVIARNGPSDDIHSYEAHVQGSVQEDEVGDNHIGVDEDVCNAHMDRSGDAQNVDVVRRPSDLDDDDDEDSPSLQVFLIYDPEDKALDAESEMSELSSVGANDNSGDNKNSDSVPNGNVPARGSRGNKRSRSWMPGKKSRRRIAVQGSKIPIRERTGDPTRLAPQQRLFRCLRARRQRNQRREMSMTVIRLLQLFMAIPFLFAPTLYLILERPEGTAPSPAPEPSSGFMTFPPTFHPTIDVESDGRLEVIPPEVSDGSGWPGDQGEGSNSLGVDDEEEEEDVLALLERIVVDSASSDHALRSRQDVTADLDNPSSVQHRAVHEMAAFDGIASDLIEFIRLDTSNMAHAGPARRALLERYALVVLAMEATNGVGVPTTDFGNSLKGVCEWNNAASRDFSGEKEFLGVGCGNSDGVDGTRRRLHSATVPTRYLRGRRWEQQQKIFSSLLPDLRPVRHLALPSSGLAGALPPDIGLLEGALTRLELQGNAFRGKIPLTIGALDHLEYLDLSDNAFDGPIPWSLFWLSPPKLQVVNLRSNQLTSIEFPDPKAASSGSYFQIPSSSTSGSSFVASSIRELHLKDNKLSGNITFLCDLLPQLETLTADCDMVTCSCCQGCE